MIIVASVWPSGETPDIAPPDKLWHAVAYGSLTLWFCGIYDRRRSLLIGASAFLLGVLVELAQSFTATRQAEFLDLVANLVGIMLALLVARMGADRWCAMVESALVSAD